MTSIRLKDIADQLNLSPSTVSRALRDHPKISPETKRRVLALAQRYDYSPDSIAQSLQNKKTRTIGVIVPQIKQGFFASVINGIEEVAYEAGYMIIVSQSNEEYEKEVFYTRAMVSNRVAGLLVSLSMTTRKLDHFRQLQRRKIPIVFFDRVTESLRTSKVVVDDYNGAFNAVMHLIKSGFKRIAHLAGPKSLSISRNRLNGYKHAFQECGLPYDDRLVVHGGLDDTDGIAGFNHLISTRIIPEAVFAVNDPVATGAFLAIKAAGFKVPEDIALVGFSNNTISGLLEPPLTTVEQPSHEMGRTAMGLLLEQIESADASAQVKKITLKTRLIIRRSSQSKSAN